MGGGRVGHSLIREPRAIALECPSAEATMSLIHPELLVADSVGELDPRDRDSGRGE